jgi:hypothetical protein
MYHSLLRVCGGVLVCALDQLPQQSPLLLDLTQPREQYASSPEEICAVDLPKTRWELVGVATLLATRRKTSGCRAL